MKAIHHAAVLAALFVVPMLATDSRADWAYDYNTGQVVPGYVPTGVDPGSYQYVNRYVTDAYGSTWHEVGPIWTSGGVPQSRVSRTLVSQGYYAYPRHVVTPVYPYGPRVGVVAPGVRIGIGVPAARGYGYGYGYGVY